MNVFAHCHCNDDWTVIDKAGLQDSMNIRDYDEMTGIPESFSPSGQGKSCGSKCMVRQNMAEVMYAGTHNLTKNQLLNPPFRELTNAKGEESIAGSRIRRQLTPEFLSVDENGRNFWDANIYTHQFEHQPYEEKNIPKIFDKLNVYMQAQAPERFYQELKKNANLYVNRHFMGIAGIGIIAFFGYLSTI